MRGFISGSLAAAVLFGLAGPLNAQGADYANEAVRNIPTKNVQVEFVGYPVVQPLTRDSSSDLLPGAGSQTSTTLTKANRRSGYSDEERAEWLRNCRQSVISWQGQSDAAASEQGDFCASYLENFERLNGVG